MKRLNSFLHFGYFTDYESPKYKLDYSGIDKSQYDNFSTDEILEIVWKSLVSSFEKYIDTDKPVVVPLSGGMDSRFILGMLLNYYNPKDIFTYTVGTKGTLDFDLARKVANLVGTNHREINLPDYNYTLSEFKEISKRTSHQCVLFFSHPISIIDSYPSNSQIWTGFMGDNLFGSSFEKYPSKDISSAIQRWIKIDKRNIIDTSAVSLADPNFDLSRLIDMPFVHSNKISFDEQLNLYYRQVNHVSPHLHPSGLNYVTPFFDQKLIDLVLSLPDRYRKNVYLYKLLSLEKFPELFSLPNKRTWGLPVSASQFQLNWEQKKYQIYKKIGNLFGNYHNERINYLDYSSAIINDENINFIISSNLKSLSERNLINWIDIETIFQNHIDGKENHSISLLILSSLEIHLSQNNNLLD